MKKVITFSMLLMLLLVMTVSAKPAYAKVNKGIAADVVVPPSDRDDDKKDSQKSETASDSEESTKEKTKDTGYYVKRIIISAVIGLIVALITIGIMKSGMNNVTKSRSAADYVVKDSFRLSRNDDRFISTTQTRTKKSN